VLKNVSISDLLDSADSDLGESPLSMELNVQSSVWSLRGPINLRELAVTLNLGEIRSEIERGTMES